MKAKGTILDILEWKNSRRFFAWRIHRRVLEEQFVKKIKEADPSLSHPQALITLQKWVHSVDWTDNKVSSQSSCHLIVYADLVSTPVVKKDASLLSTRCPHASASVQLCSARVKFQTLTFCLKGRDRSFEYSWNHSTNWKSNLRTQTISFCFKTTWISRPWGRS